MSESKTKTPVDPDQAIRDAYLGVEVEIDGKKFRARPLKIKDSIRFLGLLAQAEESGSGRAIVSVLEEFPKAIGADDDAELAAAIEGLMPTEFFDLMRRFFTLRRTPPILTGQQQAAAEIDRTVERDGVDRHPNA